MAHVTKQDITCQSTLAIPATWERESTVIQHSLQHNLKNSDNMSDSSHAETWHCEPADTIYQFVHNIDRSN